MAHMSDDLLPALTAGLGAAGTKTLSVAVRLLRKVEDARIVADMPSFLLERLASGDDERAAEAS